MEYQFVQRAVVRAVQEAAQALVGGYVVHGAVQLKAHAVKQRHEVAQMALEQPVKAEAAMALRFAFDVGLFVAALELGLTRGAVEAGAHGQYQQRAVGAGNANAAVVAAYGAALGAYQYARAAAHCPSRRAHPNR